MNTLKRILLSLDNAEGVIEDTTVTEDNNPGDNQQTIINSATGEAVNLNTDDLNQPIGDDDDEEITVVESTPTPAVKSTPAPVITPSVATNGRDYSFFKDFPDDEKVFRASSPNPIFNWAKQRLPELYAQAKKAIELEQKLTDLQKNPVQAQPQSFLEHPDAFVLNPQFNQAQTNYQLVSEEEAHWMQQLKNIKQGKSWTDITSRDEKGRLVTSAPIEIATEEDRTQAEIDIQALLYKAQQYKSDFSNQIQNIKQQHAQGYQREIQQVQEEAKKYFPWQSNPVLQENEIEIDDKGSKVKIKDALTNAIQYLAPHHRNHPLAHVYANLAVTNVIANTTIRKLQAENAKLNQTVKDIQSSEPGPSAAKGATSRVKTKIKGDSWSVDTNEIGSLDDLTE